jgi:hypothetical protein
MISSILVVTQETILFVLIVPDLFNRGELLEKNKCF